MKLFRVTYKLITLSYLAVIAVPVMFIYSFGEEEPSAIEEPSTDEEPPANKKTSTNEKLSANKKLTPNKKQKAYRKKWLQNIVKSVGLDVQVKGDIATDVQSSLWVANHISWMDIAVVGSQGVGFLSKSEVRKWPFIGWLGDKGGTIFIDRGGKNASQVAAKAIAEKITTGDSILVFPEGTTGSGDNVKRFHARIFAPALDHGLLVQPIVIQYLDEKDQPHPKAVWINQSFMSNVLGVLGQPRIRVVLTFLPLVDAKEFAERRQLASLIENQIRDVVVSTNSLKME
ncbi:MAG: 1-acyl-sn-glycerol-3-phosphate acyltransferase [Cocleimonas sp.]|jgi:1-acyl-sn-glycerol-3-phosphate acyltransferase